MINIIHSLTRAYWSVKRTLFCPLYPLIQSVVKFLSLLCALISWVMRIIRPVVCNYFVGCEKKLCQLYAFVRTVRSKNQSVRGTRLFGQFHQLAVDLYLMFILWTPLSVLSTYKLSQRQISLIFFFCLFVCLFTWFVVWRDSAEVNPSIVIGSYRSRTATNSGQTTRVRPSRSIR